MKSYKKEFGKLKDVTTMGAAVAQTSTLFTTYKGNPAGAIPGMIGVGIAGGVANASFRLASGDMYKKRKRR